MSGEFKRYRRNHITEMRPWVEGDDMTNVSISVVDRQNGSPKEGDHIARNPDNHNDMWLVSAKYVVDRFQLIEGD